MVLKTMIQDSGKIFWKITSEMSLQKGWETHKNHECTLPGLAFTPGKTAKMRGKLGGSRAKRAKKYSKMARYYELWACFGCQTGLCGGVKWGSKGGKMAN